MHAFYSMLLSTDTQTEQWILVYFNVGFIYLRFFGQSSTISNEYSKIKYLSQKREKITLADRHSKLKLILKHSLVITKYKILAVKLKLGLYFFNCYLWIPKYWMHLVILNTIRQHYKIKG